MMMMIIEVWVFMLRQVPMDAWSNVGNLWSVPEMTTTDGSDAVGGNEGWKRELREAGVLRYKKKRQNRLFSKRIRYEVRKLNAEKRPRMKVPFAPFLLIYFLSIPVY